MTSQQKKDFINKYKQDFVDATYNTGLFPSLTMAQAILESGWGKSELATKYNAFFGIKAQPYYVGTKVLLSTIEEKNGQKITIKDYFRTYRNYFDGLVDRNNFLKQNQRYTKYGVFTAKTPEEQAQALQKAGYATDSNYANSLITIINQNNLKQLDTLKPNKYRSTTKTKVIVAIAIAGLSTIGYIWYKFKN